jgi:transcriptional regulator with XRE-family HTH domain
MARQRSAPKTVWDRRSDEENEYATEVSKRIAQARKEAEGMTQRELADLLGVTERSVAAYESGEVIPYRFMRDLEKFLNRPAGWFLHGDGAISTEHDDQLAILIEEVKKLRAEVRKLSTG